MSIALDYLNKLTDGGRIQYGDIGNPQEFLKRYEWYKQYLKKELPEFTEEEIIKFNKFSHKFKDVVYAFRGFDVALELLELENRAKK